MCWCNPNIRTPRCGKADCVPPQQPAPIVNDGPCIQDLVIQDMEGRKVVGLQRYGTLLQPFNGRDALRDAYEEALDLAQYLRQAIEERDTLLKG
jgi:hypothetical protein